MLMTTFLLALALVGVSVAGLAVGVIGGRRPISGSCGGLACVPGSACGACARHGAQGEDR